MANRIEKQRGKYSIVIKRKIPRGGTEIKDDKGNKAFKLYMSENEKQIVMLKDFLADVTDEEMLDAFLLARETALELDKGLFVDNNISDKLNVVNFVLMPNSDKQIPLTFSEIEKMGDIPLTLSLEGIKHELNGESIPPHIKYYNGSYSVNRVGNIIKTTYLSVQKIHLPKDKNIKIIFPSDFEQISESMFPTCEFMQSLKFSIENDDWSKVEFINNKDSQDGKYAIVTKLNEENRETFAFPKRVESNYILAIESSYNKDHVYLL